MERFVKGEVIVMNFPYTNLSNVKKRPALIVTTPKGDNVILVQITSQEREDENAILLKKSDFSGRTLKQDSFVIPSIIFTTEVSSIEYKVGKLKPEKIKEVENKLCEIFKRN